MLPFSRAKRLCGDKSRHTPLDIRVLSDDRRASVSCCSSVVERTLGKGEAESSILSSSTIPSPDFIRCWLFPKPFVRLRCKGEVCNACALAAKFLEFHGVLLLD